MTSIETTQIQEENMKKLKRIWIVGVCLVAVLGMSALPVADASAAAPEIGRCIKQAAKSAAYANSGCTKLPEKAKTGQYEWFPGAAKAKFTTKGGLALLETRSGTKVLCRTETSGGEYTGTKTVGDVVVKFTGCESAGFPCGTVGAKEGELVTRTLEGLIGWQNKAKKQVAFDLFPAGKAGFFIEFRCGPVPVRVQGSLLVKITAGKMAPSMTIKYTETNAKQKPEKFEGEPKDVLESSLNGMPFEQAAQKLETVQTDEEPLEANWFV